MPPLTGNNSKGFQVEKRSAGRAARRLLAPVATPVGLGATKKPDTQSLLRPLESDNSVKVSNSELSFSSRKLRSDQKNSRSRLEA